MTTTHPADEHAWEAVRWLVRLPFLGAEELALLLGIDERRAGRLLSDLEQLGWLEWIVPASPELEPRRLYLLTEPAALRAPGLLPACEEGPSGPWAIGWAETLARLLRIETVVGLNRFFAELIAALPRDGSIRLTGVRSLPRSSSREPRWWPPEVEGAGCLHWGPWIAPFFVAWDRAGAPARHRRLRVARWYAFHETDHDGGNDGLAPILVICPSEREAETWADAVLAGADRRCCPTLPMLLTTLDRLSGHPLGPAWRRVEGSQFAPVTGRLRWLRPLPLEGRSGTVEDGSPAVEALPHAGTRLRDWARASTAQDTQPPLRTTHERLAALSLVASPTHKLVLQWLGHHPLLSVADLAVLLELPPRLVERLLDGLLGWRLIERLVRLAEGEACAVPRFFLTQDGLRIVAASDGVPPRRYARFGVMAAGKDSRGRGGERLGGLVRHFEHSVGANSFFVRLAADARGAGRGLRRWLSASECPERFTHSDQRHWLRPDGAGELIWDHRLCPFVLEWDRGTSRWPDMIEKCRLYVAYIASRRVDRDEKQIVPKVLVVTTTTLRESIIWEIFEATCAEVGVAPAPFLTTVEGLLERLGPLGRVWRPSGVSDRRSWP